MKRKRLSRLVILTSLMSFVCSIVVYGQAGELSYGAKVGASFGGFTHNYNVYSQQKIGLAGGAVVNYNVIDILGVGLEVNFQQTGALHVSPFSVYPDVLIDNTELEEAFTDVTINSLNIPLIVSFTPLAGSEISPRIIAGFSYDLYLNATAKDYVYSDFMPLEMADKNDASNYYKQHNYGPLAGIAFDINTGGLTYFIEARYQVGLSDISNVALLRSINWEWNYSVNTITVSVGVKLK